jgi:hypothetical protein
MEKDKCKKMGEIFERRRMEGKVPIIRFIITLAPAYTEDQNNQLSLD